MRLRNIKNQKEIFEKSNCYIENPESYKGKTDMLFQKKQPLHVEIGMGKGDFLIEMAKRYPQFNFIGIEKFDKVLARALKKVPKDLNNLKIYRYDARNISNLFSKEVDQLYLNFSDPWPKKRTEKHRLTSPLFLKQYDQIFRKEKRIQMKTDNVPLFLYSIESLSQHGYGLFDLSLDYHKEESLEKVYSEYEKKFASSGVPICYMRAIGFEKIQENQKN